MVEHPLVRTNLAATYETQVDLQAVIDSFSTQGEKAAAALLFLLTWNFCARQFELALEEEETRDDR